MTINKHNPDARRADEIIVFDLRGPPIMHGSLQYLAYGPLHLAYG